MTPLHDHQESSSIYIDQRILPLLLPALEEILLVADKRNSLLIQKAPVDVLGNLPEIIWNWNPRRSNIISSSQSNMFAIPRFQQWLSLRWKPTTPNADVCLHGHARYDSITRRSQSPKPWLWSKTAAAQCLQRYVRGWLVRKRVDVQELRQFWKASKRIRIPLSILFPILILNHGTSTFHAVLFLFIV
ncbi:LOW QUALITY PROTEIN: uncharacterized protein LOC116432762 [Nomia melanderi]|uniref:LOW QUALITY PROTEIN: uncharacterized protein LOC116432762 n=1 Tax=Nomia melanderi TaxID=2448451 RepID=UPI003FCD32B5